MTKEMTLSQIGYEYLFEAEEVDRKIKNYNTKLREAIQAFRADEIIRLRRMLRLYYEQRSELRYAGNLLVNYYNEI
ncbi:MAG: hypothetical protein IIX39_00385 [Clostridia bacterium]|nr:hypothetical protein [Clostridia bacterium]